MGYSKSGFGVLNRPVRMVPIRIRMVANRIRMVANRIRMVANRIRMVANRIIYGITTKYSYALI